ncbi:DgyrCDS4917 [Dimorphilus gyrociliatus]|uniref:DgyrCDS4917 n=1 Tax=Dimorphilus gyrociliatus TaxID=2664684 RepID=A0A7I8VL06_9ANNE|nr:DgyrCDS4917 [Dimorphilus gyrociliatus]
MDHIKKDERFSHISKDPKFRKLARKDRKVKIDKRFHGMFKDKKFKVTYTVDKRGRPVKTSSTDHLKKLYDLDSDENEDDSETDESQDEDESDEDVSEKIQDSKQRKKLKDTNKKSESKSSEGEEEEESGSDEEEESEDDEGKLDLTGPDLARGEGAIDSSSSEEEYELEDERFDHEWGEVDKNVKRSEEITCRLACCNQDWDRIRAEDLLMIFNSFKPSTGVVKSITIYPSEFGLQRMKQEDLEGPKELFEKEESLATSNDQVEGEDYHREKLRQYQLKRLKYYYAIVDCDSPETANAIYEQCDGVEFETSSTKMDLRFVPDDMTFSENFKARVSDVDLLNYKPILFKTTALMRSNVELTWDETDRSRSAILNKKFKKDEIDNLNIKDYLASSSEDSACDEENGNESNDDDDNENIIEKKRNKYKALLEEIDTKDEENEKEDKNDVNMEIKWNTGLKAKSEEIVKKAKDDKELSVFEKYLEKRKEKKKLKRRKTAIKESDEGEDEDMEENGFQAFSDDDVGAESPPPKKKKKGKKSKIEKRVLTAEEEEEEKKAQAELSLLMEDDDNRKHFNLSSIIEAEKFSKLSNRRKKKLLKKNKDRLKLEKESQDDFQLNLNDDRFSKLYSNPSYNIDPSAPQFKKTKAMDNLVKEKIKRSSEIVNTEIKKVKKENNDIKALVAAVKMKANKKKKAKS